MPKLSSRTLGRVIKILAALPPEDADTFPLLRDFWRQKLFEWGFPGWLVQGAAERSFNWTRIIPDLYMGSFSTKSHPPIPAMLAKQMLHRLTALALTEAEDASVREDVRLSLQLDGFELGTNGLRAVDGPVSVEEERSRLIASLNGCRLGRKDVISKHIADAEDLFNNGKHHSAIGEARSALQAVIEETVKLVEERTRQRSGSGTVNQVDFLAREGVFTPDEQQAFRAAWAFLSSGNHPGVPPEEDGRIGMILCLEFIQILLLKGKSLLQ